MAESDRQVSEDAFDDTPRGIAARLDVEFAAARKELRKFHKQGREAISRFRDDRGREEQNTRTALNSTVRLNIYTSDVQIEQAILFGQLPKVDVERRFNDALDEPARVASELWERVLNYDMQGNDVSVEGALRSTVTDLLIPGFCNARIAYVCELEDVPGQEAIEERIDPETGETRPGAPEVPPTQRKVSENCEIRHLSWDDQLYSPCKTFDQMRWWAHRNEMPQKDLVARFAKSLARMTYDQPDSEDENGNVIPGEKLTDEEAQALGEPLAKQIPLNAGRDKDLRKDRGEEEKLNQPWGRADVWEVWHKDDGYVYWYVEGYGTLLDMKPDPLQLEGFWPFPEPILANVTPDKFVAVSDYRISEDLYTEIDLLSTRITRLTDSIQVRGIYDQTRPEIARVLSEGRGEQMIPTPNWEMFSSKGGLKQLVDWFPLDPVVNALDKLWEKRQGLIDMVRQIRGISDIMRGQQQENGTPGEAHLKVLFGSVRMREKQKRIARFVGELMSLKAEVMAKHFDPQNILERANAKYMFDAPQPAVGANLPQNGPVGAPQPGVGNAAGMPGNAPTPFGQPGPTTPGLSQPPNPVIMQALAQAKQAKLIQDALALMTSRFQDYRITVKADSLASEDFAELKTERTDFLSGMSGMFGQMQPILQAWPAAMPHLIELAKWSISGMKGAKEAEGIFDRMSDDALAALAAKAANPQQQPPNPEAMKLQVESVKAQTRMQELQAQHQMRLQEIQAETAADLARDRSQAAQEAAQDRAQHQMEMETARYKAQVDLEKAKALEAEKAKHAAMAPLRSLQNGGMA